MEIYYLEEKLVYFKDMSDLEKFLGLRNIVKANDANFAL